MPGIKVKITYESTEADAEGKALAIPPGAVSCRVQERVASVGQDADGNDTVVYTWKDVGTHRGVQPGIQTELSKKQRLIFEVVGDI